MNEPVRRSVRLIALVDVAVVFLAVRGFVTRQDTGSGRHRPGACGPPGFGPVEGDVGSPHWTSGTVAATWTLDG